MKNNLTFRQLLLLGQSVLSSLPLDSLMVGTFQKLSIIRVFLPWSDAFLSPLFCLCDTTWGNPEVNRSAYDLFIINDIGVFGGNVKSYFLSVLVFYLRLHSSLNLEYDRLLLKTTVNCILDYTYMTFNVNRSETIKYKLIQKV